MSIKVSAILRLWGMADTLSGGLRLVFGSFVDTKEQYYLRLWAMPSHAKSMVMSGESQQKNAKGR